MFLHVIFSLRIHICTYNPHTHTHTFSNAERVVTTGHEIVECDKQVGVILAGASQQVLFGVPAGRFRQTLTLNVGSLESFWKRKGKENTELTGRATMLSTFHICGDIKQWGEKKHQK